MIIRVRTQSPFIVRLLSLLLFGVVFNTVGVTQAHALGLSPPEEEIGYLPVGSVQTVAATISRSIDELSGSLSITVTPRKSAAGFFHGDLSFIIQEGIREYTYLYSIIPSYPDRVDQELYVTFLLQPTTISTGGVGVVTGVTQVVRFTTDIVLQPGRSGSSSGSGGGSNGNTTTSPDADEGESESEDESESLDETQETEEETEAQEQAVETEQENSPEEAEIVLEEPTLSQDEQNLSEQEESPIVVLGKEESLEKIYQPIELESSTHSFEDVFYRGLEVVFSWLEPGSSADTTYAFILTREPSAQADDLINHTKNPSVSFENLPDGIYYFHLLDFSDPEQKIMTKKIQIDNTSPIVDPKVVISSLPFFLPKSRFIKLGVFDALSGVRSTRAELNGVEIDIGETGIPLRGLGFGTYTLTVEATDLAGNTVDKMFVVEVAPKYPMVVQIVSSVKETIINLFSSIFFFKQ